MFLSSVKKLAMSPDQTEMKEHFNSNRTRNDSHCKEMQCYVLLAPYIAVKFVFFVLASFDDLYFIYNTLTQTSS